MYASKAVQKGALIAVKNYVENVNAHTLKSGFGVAAAGEPAKFAARDTTSARGWYAEWNGQKVSNTEKLNYTQSVRVKLRVASGEYEYVLDNNNKSAQATPR
jgi:hypothetical protein